MRQETQAEYIHTSLNHKTTDASSNYTAVYKSIVCPPLNSILSPTQPETMLIPSRTQCRSWLGRDPWASPQNSRINPRAEAGMGGWGVDEGTFNSLWMGQQMNEDSMFWQLAYIGLTKEAVNAAISMSKHWNNSNLTLEFCWVTNLSGFIFISVNFHVGSGPNCEHSWGIFKIRG